MNRLLLTPDQQQLLIKLYNDKIPVKSIMSQLNIKSTATFFRYIKMLGIKLKGHFNANRKYNVNHHYFDIIDTEEKAYWLGFMYADGYIIYRRKSNQKSVNIVGLTLSAKDVAHIEKFKKAISAENPIRISKANFYLIKKYIGRRYLQAKLNITSHLLCENLIKLGCVPRKSLIIKFPSQKIISDDLLCHFLRGYFDGDGWITHSVIKNQQRKHYKLGICSGSRKFILGMRDKISSILGINASLTKRKNLTIINYAGNWNFMAIADWLYKDATIFLERKHKLYQDCKQQGLINTKRGENHYLSYGYKFIDKNGMIYQGKGLREFCRKYPSFSRGQLTRLLKGFIPEYKGLKRVL